MTLLKLGNSDRSIRCRLDAYFIELTSTGLDAVATRFGIPKRLDSTRLASKVTD